jgi:hypothetical protein
VDSSEQLNNLGRGIRVRCVKPQGKTVAAKRLALTLALLVVMGCSPNLGVESKADAPRWRVTGHVGSEWTFSRRVVDEMPARRIVATCSSYHWQGHDQVNGDDACSLDVGEGLVEPLEALANSNRNPGLKLPMIDVITPDTVAITEGDGAYRVMQLFKIKRDEVQP